MSTLCIIDMQDEFLETPKRQKIIPRVIHEIRLVKKRKYPIIILEYYGYGKTHSEIRKAIGYYSNFSIIKTTDGGGYEIGSVAKKRKIPIKKIRLCGVNRGFCVFATALELLHLVPDIQIETAVNASWCSEPAKGLRMLGRVSRLLFHGNHIDNIEINVFKPVDLHHTFRNTNIPAWYDVKKRCWKGKRYEPYIPNGLCRTVKS